MELTALDDIPIVGAALILGLLPGTPGVQLHRAKQRLRDAHFTSSRTTVLTGSLQISRDTLMTDPLASFERDLLSELHLHVVRRKRIRAQKR